MPLLAQEHQTLAEPRRLGSHSERLVSCFVEDSEHLNQSFSTSFVARESQALSAALAFGMQAGPANVRNGLDGTRDPCVLDAARAVSPSPAFAPRRRSGGSGPAGRTTAEIPGLEESFPSAKAPAQLRARKEVELQARRPLLYLLFLDLLCGIDICPRQPCRPSEKTTAAVSG